MEIRPARREEMDAALALVASYAGGPPAQAVATLREAARRGEIDLKELTVAVEEDRLLGAVLAIITPGRAGFVTTPGVVERPLERAVSVALLAHWRAEAAARNLALIQAFLAPEDRRHRRHLEEAGFERLADLLYLERDSATRTGEGRDDFPGVEPEALVWRTYSRQTHPAFARVIAETYRGTLDCPRLGGLRPIEDVIAGHKAQGQFDPRRWFLLEHGESEVGCLLLNAIPERQSLDITYMGLVPAARRKGLGAALVQHAIDRTRLAGRPRLTCAVDDNNLPAIKTYARFDFRSIDRKRVFVAVPPKATNH